MELIGIRNDRGTARTTGTVTISDANRGTGRPNWGTTEVTLRAGGMLSTLPGGFRWDETMEDIDANLKAAGWVRTADWTGVEGERLEAPVAIIED
ncbi:hypothetical protein [Oerskovia turbata]